MSKARLQYHWAAGENKNVLFLTKSSIKGLKNEGGLTIRRDFWDHLEKAMVTHSSTLAWKIPWTEEPGGLPSMGSWRVRHNWATSLSLSCIGEGNGNPLQCSCLENPRDGGAEWAAVYGVAQSQTRLKRLSSSSCSVILELSTRKAQLVKNLPDMWETWVRPLGWEDPLEKGKATHSGSLV